MIRKILLPNNTSICFDENNNTVSCPITPSSGYNFLYPNGSTLCFDGLGVVVPCSQLVCCQPKENGLILYKTSVNSNVTTPTLINWDQPQETDINITITNTDINANISSDDYYITVDATIALRHTNASRTSSSLVLLKNNAPIHTIFGYHRVGNQSFDSLNLTWSFGSDSTDTTINPGDLLQIQTSRLSGGGNLTLIPNFTILRVTYQQK